jgi:Bacterial Ig-like domain (group 3)
VAKVAPPQATGTVQFKDGTQNVGTPVKVIFGFALQVTKLAAGSHTLTAVFTPADPKAFQPSTSNPVTVAIKKRY